MGLDPPRSQVAVFAGDDAVLSIAFGGLNPSDTGQYARLEGQSGLLLLPLHVGREWQVLARGTPDHRAIGPAVASPSPSQ